jgi:PKD repeat protein
VSGTWSFGDGVTSTEYATASHAFNPGLYEVCLTVTADECVSTHCEIIDLTDPCLQLSARYQANVDAENVMQYAFTDMSNGPIGSRLWGFGDGQISTAANPEHTYQNIGVYTVCLLVMDSEGNCTDSDCRTLYVGTTGTDPGQIPMKKMTVVPNPVATSASFIHASGFETGELGRDARILLFDMHGQQVNGFETILDAQEEISVPEIPGVYFLRVVTVKNMYGAMIAVQ